MEEQDKEPEFVPMSTSVLLRILGFFLALFIIPWVLMKIVDLVFG